MNALEQLSTRCHELGIELLGVAPVPRLEDLQSKAWFAQHVARLEDWIGVGAQASMEWMSTQLDLRCDPQLLLPDARSALVLWLGHRFEPPMRPPYRTARVATYAWGRDYHNILRRVLRQLGKLVKELDPRAEFHGSVDTSPVLERAFAERAHVGWIGKSTMLIHPRKGTYGSLAVLLTTLDLPSEPNAHPKRCGTCVTCFDQCPTGALSPQGLDARRCISYWTIEHRGVIPRAMRPLLGAWVFGCDICQEVCPWNRRAPYEGESSRALWDPQFDHIWPDLVHWLQMSDEALNESLLGSPLRRAFPYGLKRNALIALANQNAYETLPLIEQQLTHSDLGVQTAALWALVTLTKQGVVHGRFDVEQLACLTQKVWTWLAEDEHAPVLKEELVWAYATLCDPM